MKRPAKSCRLHRFSSNSRLCCSKTLISLPLIEVYAQARRVFCFKEDEYLLRPESTKIDAWDITGAWFTVNLSGLPARVFQLGFDHLQGTLFLDRMTEEILDSIRAEL